jgi:hypothetical protein
MAKWGEFNFDELRRLAKNLKDMEKELPKFFEECVREIALRLLAKVVLRTPVKTGELRRGWTIGRIQRINGGWQVDVFNPVLYAIYVEYGHRGVYVPALGVTLHVDTHWTEGKFMLTISEQELQRELPAILKRKQEAFLKKYLG